MSPFEREKDVEASRGFGNNILVTQQKLCNKDFSTSLSVPLLA